ncbi:MAG TPA: zf-HC2 domain-containing protein, partial [Xylella taiwanensis]
MKTFSTEPGQDCLKAWELMPAMLQNRITEEEKNWLTTHLAQCEACNADFEQQQRL